MDMVSFWLDRWCTKIPLAKLFPMLYEIGKTKNATVAQALGKVARVDIGGCLGSVHFHHQQLAFVASELNRLHSKFSLSGVKDELAWERGSEVLSVAHCYEKILKFRLQYFSPGVFTFEWDKVWLLGVPSKASFCVWLQIRDRLLTD